MSIIIYIYYHCNLLYRFARFDNIGMFACCEFFEHSIVHGLFITFPFSSKVAHFLLPNNGYKFMPKNGYKFMSNNGYKFMSMKIVHNGHNGRKKYKLKTCSKMDETWWKCFTKYALHIPSYKLVRDMVEH